MDDMDEILEKSLTLDLESMKDKVYHSLVEKIRYRKFFHETNESFN